MEKKHNKKNMKQLLRFGTVGVFNTLLDYGLFYVFISPLHLHKSIAQVFATAIAMCSSYLLNRHWTFGKAGRGHFGEMAKFVAVNLLSMLTVIFFTHLFYDVLHAERTVNAALASMGASFAFSGDMAIMLCKLFASVFSLMVNFFGNKFWVFQTKR